MAEELRPDVCVIGGGPGGIAAALAGTAEGMPVILVERGKTGGANLATGTIPSKSLVAAANVYEALRVGPVFGVTGAPLQVNLGKVREHIAAVGEAVAPYVAPERLAALGVRIIPANAWFTDRRTVVAGDHVIHARRFILAIGAVPTIPEIQGLDTVEYMTTASTFDLTRKPAHLIVLGAGRHALELAQAYNRLGVDSTVIDEGPALPEDDPELAAIVTDRLRAEGIRVRAGVRIMNVARRRGGVRFSIADPAEGETTVDGSHLLVAMGRSPDVEGLGLAAAGIDYDRAGLTVDRYLRTTNRRVYAIGDAVAGPASANKAEHQAARVVRSIAFHWQFADDPAAVPVVTFTDPALATVGLSEAEARKRYRDVETLRFPFIENERAQVERLPAGMIKVVATKGGRILGAAIVGRDAGELIALWSLAIANNLPLAAMRALNAGYPTRSEIARRVAAGRGVARLTSPWRRRIIDILRNLG